MHMEDMWHLCHCDTRLWTHSPYPLHFQFWHIMSMVCPCTISPLLIENYPHHIGLLPGLGNIWHLPSHRPKSWWCGHLIHELLWLSLLQLDYSTYFVFCKKKWNHKNNEKKGAWSPLPPFFKVLCTNYSKQLNSFMSKKMEEK